MILGANSTSDPMRDAMNRNLNQQQTLQSFSSEMLKTYTKLYCSTMKNKFHAIKVMLSFISTH